MIGAFDILTDVAIIVLPLYIVHDLQMARSQKAIVVGAFSSRLLWVVHDHLFPIVELTHTRVIPATVCRLVYLPQALHTSDPTFDYYSFFLCTQLEMNISIVASCVPYLKPFFESLQGGMLSIEVGRHSPSRTRSHLSKGSYAMDRLSSNGKDASSERAGFGTQRSLRPDADLFRNHTTVTMAVVDRRADGDGDSDTTAGSDKMIIKQTREWRVDYNDKQQESA